MKIIDNKILISNNNIFFLKKAVEYECKPCIGYYLNLSDCISKINKMIGINSHLCHAHLLGYKKHLRISLSPYKSIFVVSYTKSLIKQSL